MGQTEFEINDEQAKMFARRIFMDISEYIKTHQKEYEEFKLNQKQGGIEHNENKVTLRHESIQSKACPK